MTTMDVEVVDIRKIISGGNLKAIADLKLGGCLMVTGFSVMQGKNGIFVSMPRKTSKDGRWFDVLTPTDENLKQDIENKVLEAYDQEKKKGAPAAV